MTDDPLPDEHHVVRHCRPRWVGTDDMPTPAAFYLRPGEFDLSVNWLEYFGLSDTHDAIDRIRESFIARDFDLGRRGKFACLKIDDLKHVLRRHTQTRPTVTHQPLENNCSHAGIFGLPPGEDTLEALLLAALLHSDCVFPARA